MHTTAIRYSFFEQVFRYLKTPIYMDARPFIFAVFAVALWSFVDVSSPAAAALLRVRNPTPAVVTDTVRVEVPADSLTRYILAEMEKVESKFLTPGRIAPDAHNPFEVALFELFRREGYVPKPYRCPAGLETVGFGDVIDTDAEKVYRDGMAFSVARAKVYTNLKIGADEIRRRFPGQYQDPAEWLALCLLGHSIGWDRLEGKYPAFYAEMVAGNPSSRWLKYCRYRDGKTGKVKSSPNLSRTRNIEWLLFNRDWSALTKYHADASRVARIRYDDGRALSLQRLGRE